MKKLLSLILVLIFILSATCNAVAIINEPIIISELSDTEKLEFLKTRGLIIPEIYEDESQCIPFISMVVKAVEDNPNAIFSFNFHVLEDFACEIQSIVVDYYNSFSLPSTYTLSYNNILEDNTVHGSWTNAYKNYRCYSYVMDYTYYVQPGQIKWIISGNNKDDYSYNYAAANIQTIAEQVIEDLNKLGYQNIVSSTSMLNTTVSLHTHLICMRKDTDTTYDYHFMQLGLDGYWYHKPGQTNPLRYKYSPSNDRVWTAEGYDGETNRYYRYDNVTYDSEIYYIEFTTPHLWIFDSAAPSTHTRTCTICNHTETLNCNYKYTYLYDDMHNATCVDCGNTIPGGNCSFTYTSNNNGTHTGVCACGNTKTSTCYAGSYTAYPNGRHGKNCSQCGYNMGNENCTYTCTYLDSDTHSRQCVKCGTTADPSACSYSYKYHGSVNGQNTHVEICAGCARIKSGPTQCSYIGSKPCRFCGTPKGGSVLNNLEEDFSEN